MYKITLWIFSLKNLSDAGTTTSSIRNSRASATRMKGRAEKLIFGVS